MMPDNHEHIYHLLLKKRDGTISEKDDQYVTGLIKVHEDIELMWSALKDSIAIPGEALFWEQVDPHHAWKNVSARIYVRRTGMWWTRKLMLAALITAVVFTGVSFVWKYTQRPVPQATVAPAVAPIAQTGLQLQLSDGKTISLPYNQAGQQINTAGVQLNASAKRLVYTASAGAGAGLNTLAVPPKMDYKLTLADGTEVWLNATSKLRFPFNFSGAKREVYLEGEGYFKVARNEAQPFIVHTPQTDIQVLGTAFNVNAYAGSEVTASLVSGAIAATNGTERVVLKPGEQVAITKKGYEVSNFDQDVELAWMNGEYLFHNTTLQDISAVIERWYGVKVVFDTPGLAARRFTGGLKKQSTLSSFLETMKITGDINFYYDKDVLHLKA
jgi:transmembrane sensor